MTTSLAQVEPDMFHSAAERIQHAVFRTPLVRLPLPGEVYAKAENLQRTGSFKLRGAYNFLASLTDEERARGVVTHSSGNHAQGVACAAHLFGVQATIVIPEGAPRVKVERTQAWGAKVVRCDNSTDAREKTAQALVDAHGYTLVPPFDHPWIVAGQGTVGLEIAEALPDVRNVLVPVGGGGLIAGVAATVSTACPDARVIGVEPELAADAQASFTTGRIQRWDAGATTRTVADGVRTQSLGQVNFELIRRHVHNIVTVSEDAIVAAARWYTQEAKLVVEPTGALTLAAYRALADDAPQNTVLQDGPTVVLISGGNIDREQLRDLL
jgi:threonine dehydratase